MEGGGEAWVQCPWATPRPDRSTRARRRGLGAVPEGDAEA